MNPISIIFLLIGYFIILYIVSLITSRKKDNKTFYLGNRKSPWYIVAFGMIGASLSGVTFISVPGWVLTSNFSYMQIILGYFLGYLVIAYVLLPIYYKLNLTSIYTYLDNRFGLSAYKTGAALFLISRSIGSAFRLFIVSIVLQVAVFDPLGIPFFVTVLITILLIWLYTNKGGIGTIIWTDVLQTTLLLAAVILTVIEISSSLSLNFKGMVHTIIDSPMSKIFEFDDWRAPTYFFKQFFSGMFITIVMTGLDQDMMQKNLSCKNLKDAQKNVVAYGITFIPVNLLFMSLGILLATFAVQHNIALPTNTDELYPMIACGGYLSPLVTFAFIIGLVAAAYSSADSALTALTTSFTVDILGMNHDQLNTPKSIRIRRIVHIGISIVLALIIILFKAISNKSVIDAVFDIAGYTYGPLLGMFAFGLFTKYKVKHFIFPIIGILSPVFCYLIKINTERWFDGYKMGYELLILNGLITFICLFIFRAKKTLTFELNNN